MARNKKTTESLVTFMKYLIVLLAQNEQYNTMQHYQATLNSLMRFLGNKNLLLCDIDAELVQSYEAYLKNVAQVCLNTSSFYMRIFRAVYNKAVEKGYITQQRPFSHIYTGIVKTKKRAIPTESVSSIKNIDTSELTKQQELARDTFLLCFYLRGISFIDLAHLRKSDIKDGILRYTRSKTKQCLSLRWTSDMQAIVDKYSDQTASSPYLLPFLVASDDKKQDERQLYRNAGARISYHLKKLGTKLGLEGKLTLYVARHSWATTARDKDIPISIISDALGHTSTTTTQIYLDTIHSSEVDDACDKLLAAI